MGEDDLVELLWKSGHVVGSNQPERPPVLRGSGSGGGGGGDESAPLPPPQPMPPLLTHQHQPSANQNLFIHEDEMASWLHHHPLREEDLFYSGLVPTPFIQPPQGSPVSLIPPPLPPLLPPPLSPPPPMGHVIAARRAENFFNFSRVRGNVYTAPWVPVVNNSMQVGSNATPTTRESFLTPATVSGGVAHTFAVPRAFETVRDIAGPSSLGVSMTEIEPFQIQPAMETEAAADDERKRKEREEPVDDTEEHARKRARAAEMHNISERRRREKINEKMKTLQELIPRCNKTDKASMLDDAIEYVKSLQMQIQMISQGGGGMMLMMYPPRFMPPSAMGMMGVNRPPFVPFPGTPFPRLPPPYPPPPRYPPFAFDRSRLRSPSQQPSDSDPNQSQFPGLLNPYSQFVGLQIQQPPLPLLPPPPPPPLLQNQTTSQLSFSQAGTSMEPEDQGNKPTG